VSRWSFTKSLLLCCHLCNAISSVYISLVCSLTCS